MSGRKPERWATKIGVILAVAGSAIGLGNFLRFPAQAAQYGGAFMIPYFCALLFLGLPLMWLEWALGRCGGALGRHSLPGIYHVVTGRRWAKYVGVLGIYVPFVILVYYTYIESWTLAYGVYSVLGRFANVSGRQEMGAVLNDHLGISESALAIPDWGLLFLGITVALNFWVIYHGVSRGIERLTRVAMPVLFIMAVALVVRVLTLKNAGVASPAEGLNFLWQPDFSKLRDAQLWLAATGQIFFTLSLGLGAIITYGSYLRRNEDVALSGLTSASLNEFGEVILGGTIAIPAAVVFFGAVETMEVAKGGSFQLGFMAMPIIFQQMPFGNLFGMIWFLLLFFAGLTSSVSLIQPLVAFFQDEFGWSRHRSTLLLLGMTSAYLVPLVLFQKFGFLDEMDFWACNIMLPLGALIEVLVFAWLLGMKRGWQEITRGAAIRVPIIFRTILKYITPIYLLVLLVSWTWQQAIPKFLLKDVDSAALPYVLTSRAILLAILIAMVIKVWAAWQRQRAGRTIPPTPQFEEEAGLEEESR